MTVVIVRCPSGTAKFDMRNDNEHIHQWWKNRTFYEYRMLNYIQKHYSGGIFIDAGSCVGNHSIYFALFCDAKVISIEPVPHLMKWQQHNARLNMLEDRIDFYQYALSDESGWGQMENVSPDHHYNMGMNQLTVGEGKIEIKTLDSILSGYSGQRITLMKMDIEFYEIPALRGAMDLLTDQHPALFIEAPYPHCLDELEDFLFPLGYTRLEKKHNPTPTYEFIYTARG